MKEPLGQHFITGATREGVLKNVPLAPYVSARRNSGDYTKIINSGVVGGKL